MNQGLVMGESRRSDRNEGAKEKAPVRCLLSFLVKEKNGARGGSRTPTSAMDTRSLVWRVYQFRHPSSGRRFLGG